LATYTDIPTATAAIQAHPACSTFKALPGAYVVYYPAAYVVPSGTTVRRGSNDLVSLNLLYDNIDRFWTAQRLQLPAQ
jgi:hypothetical protein